MTVGARSVPYSRDGVHLHALTWGKMSNPCLVLIHGRAGCASLWGEIADLLCAHFFIVAPDLRGHGQSSRHAPDYNWSSFALDIVCLLDILGIEKFAILGHSSGARIALRTVSTQPDRVRLLIIEEEHFSTSRHVNSYESEIEGWPQRFSSSSEAECFLVSRKKSLKWWLPLLICEDHFYVWGLSIPALREISLQRMNSMWAEYAAISCPILIVKGANSDYLTSFEIHTLRQKNPLSRLEVIQDARHWVHGRQPVEFAHIVLRWMKQNESFLNGTETSIQKGL